jgi:23S rRNA (uridine2552-2'-O)-methyltransferase
MKSSKSKKVNRAWLHDHLNDTYVKLAHKEGYRARAAYKLKEIDDTFRLVKPGQVVVDLGATPGAWSQYLRRKLGTSGTIVALDVLDFEPLDGVSFLRGDFREEAVLAQLEQLLGGQPVDLVVSDMAPNLSGIPSSDAARMADLVELAVNFASRHLTAEGALVCKVFHGSGYDGLAALFKRSFRVAKPFKPMASRDKSAETFLVGLGPIAGSMQK